MPRENLNIQFVVSLGREIVQVTLWSDSSVDSRGEPRGHKDAGSHIQSAKSQIETQVRHVLCHYSAIVSASDRSVPRVTFGSTVWTMLTILVAPSP